MIYNLYRDICLEVVGVRVRIPRSLHHTGCLNDLHRLEYLRKVKRHFDAPREKKKRERTGLNLPAKSALFEYLKDILTNHVQT